MSTAATKPRAPSVTACAAALLLEVQCGISGWGVHSAALACAYTREWMILRLVGIGCDHWYAIEAAMEPSQSPPAGMYRISGCRDASV